MLRKFEWNMQGIWDTMKRPNLQIMGVEEGEETQTKSTDNLFNRIIAENFPNLKRERERERERESHPGTGSLQNTKPSGPKEEHSQTHHSQNTRHKDQRKDSESCRGEKTGHI
jgi:hypothetical protein